MWTEMDASRKKVTKSNYFHCFIVSKTKWLYLNKHNLIYITLSAKLKYRIAGKASVLKVKSKKKIKSFKSLTFRIIQSYLWSYQQPMFILDIQQRFKMCIFLAHLDLKLFSPNQEETAIFSFFKRKNYTWKTSIIVFQTFVKNNSAFY